MIRANPAIKTSFASLGIFQQLLVGCDQLLRQIFRLLILFYQKVISPLKPPSCRFYPSCSEYAASCFNQYSTAQALRKSCGRLMRCHPWHPGGVDLP